MDPKSNTRHHLCVSSQAGSPSPRVCPPQLTTGFNPSGSQRDPLGCKALACHSQFTKHPAHPQGLPFILKIKNIERAPMIGPQGTASSTFLDLLGLKCPPPSSSPNSGHSYPSPNLHVARSPSSFLSLLKCNLGKASADHFT